MCSSDLVPGPQGCIAMLRESGMEGDQHDDGYPVAWSVADLHGEQVEPRPSPELKEEAKERWLRKLKAGDFSGPRFPEECYL